VNACALILVKANLSVGYLARINRGPGVLIKIERNGVVRGKPLP
jgi:hypothetical protein